MSEEVKSNKKAHLLEQGRMLRIADVLEMWPVSRTFIWRMLNEKSDPLPSYRVGGKRLFKYDELMWYMDKHKEA